MQDIQFNKSISEDVWDDLHDTPIQAWDFSVRTYSALRRAGYDTLGEVIDSTERELREKMSNVMGVTPKRLETAIEEVREKAAEKGITLPTDKEKQDIIDALTETEQLQREINLLIQRVDELEVLNISMEQQLAGVRDKKEKAARKALVEALEIAYEKHSVPKIIERMRYCGENGGRIHFCNIFRLKEKGCALEEICLSNEELEKACQKCIDKFLREYYSA